MRKWLCSIPVAAGIVLFAPGVFAETLQAPVGGRAISLGDRVACSAVPGGWASEREGRALRPPTGEEAVGRTVALRVAPLSTGCGAGQTTITLIATARWPEIDKSSLVVHVDDARAELRGKRLKGVRLVAEGGGARSDDICQDPRTEGGTEVCTFGVSRKVPASPAALTVTWFPAGGSGDEGATTFDADGRRVAPSELALKPSRILIATLTPAGANLDVSRGVAKLPLTHPESITTVDCSPAFCDVQDNALVARGVTQTAASLKARVRLLPRVFLAKGEVSDTTPLLEVPILRCPMTVESGAPFADVDEARAVVRLEGRCAEDARSLRFYAGNNTAEVVRVDADKNVARVLLKIGRVEDEITIRAIRNDAEGTLVGLVKTNTRRLPPLMATLELESGVPIDFVPTNRAAIVRVAPPAEGMKVVVLPVEGIYTVIEEDGFQKVRAVGPGGGFIGLRFAIRSGSLPKDLADANLGILRDNVQRPMRTANVAAPLAGMVELRCTDARGRVRSIMPGQITHVPFEERDGCYVAMHRQRLHPDDGTQKLVLDINITRPDGSTRPDAKVTELTTLRPGPTSRFAWLKDVQQPFERVTIRVSHAQDEQHYATKADLPMTPPASQWAVIMGTSIARAYLTAAIPTVLYRISEKESSGILSLNFGVLGRLTWVDSEGRDGILALEAGVTGVGLAPVDTSAKGQSLRQVATVAGLGLGVPIVNRATITQTSINLHAWFEYEVSRALSGEGSPFGFIFGPSITFGNVGTYL